MARKSAHDIVGDAYCEVSALKPTPEEIQAYADLLTKENRDYGTVTYSKSKGGDYYFLRLHDTWRGEFAKFGGRVHIDLGYVDPEYVDKWNIPDTTHLMLDKYTAPEFIEFIRKRRESNE